MGNFPDDPHERAILILKIGLISSIAYYVIHHNGLPESDAKIASLTKLLTILSTL